jgi:hypothetical protein
MDQVVERIRQTENIYKQCEVSFSPIVLVLTVHVSGPIVVAEGESSKGYVDLSLILMGNAVIKPVIFMVNNEYVRESLGRTVGAGSSSRKGRVGRYDSRADTGFVYYNGGALGMASNYPDSDIMGFSQVMAHELGHILFDQPHLSVKENLMSEFGFRTNQITQDQCERIYENGFLK